jgi:hypothetical protein
MFMSIANVTAIAKALCDDYQKTAPSTADLIIKAREVESGYLAVIRSITAYDYTTAAKRIIIQIINGAVTLTLFDETLSTNNRTAQVTGLYLLPEGAYVQATIVSATEADVCHLAVNGYWVQRL